MHYSTLLSLLPLVARQSAAHPANAPRDVGSAGDWDAAYQKARAMVDRMTLEEKVSPPDAVMWNLRVDPDRHHAGFARQRQRRPERLRRKHRRHPEAQLPRHVSLRRRPGHPRNGRGQRLSERHPRGGQLEQGPRTAAGRRHGRGVQAQRRQCHPGPRHRAGMDHCQGREELGGPVGRPLPGGLDCRRGDSRGTVGECHYQHKGTFVHPPRDASASIGASPNLA
ncbi:hypothetical protein AAL_00795 [Moelleriella libera RCEF 2490]|uniref:Uncharacterized protein n=1 Tax=Moelleriella libera RCEF 2490 TaxID=1081109 RepID=A0A166V6R4_9HYPO|nr:hypothetical protein AAL_00795 [Moelleriella libera RCEF 2490]